VPETVPNTSTRIDALRIRMENILAECDAARERVADLTSWKDARARERAATRRDLEALTGGPRHLDSSTELSEARSRIASMATDGAAMVEKACQSLLYASRVRGSAEARERLIVRLVAERDDAIARSTRLEETVRELRGRIEGRNPPTDATSAVRCGTAGGGGNGG
jgi:hypothetical protein